MGETSNTHPDKRNAHTILVGKPKLWDLGVEVKKIL
jgi:hypothetical protein